MNQETTLGHVRFLLRHTTYMCNAPYSQQVRMFLSQSSLQAQFTRQRHAHVFQAWLKISAQNTVSNISFTVDYTANTFCESTSDHVVMLCSLTIPWTKHATTCCTELKSSSSFAWSCLSCSIFWKRTQKKPNRSEQIAPSQVATGFLLFSISRSWPRGSIVKAPCPWMITFLPTTFR